MYKKAFLGLLFFGIGFAFFLISVFYSLPSNVVSDRGIPSSFRVFSIDVAPQGWGFFTKPPSDPDLLFYNAKTLESLLVTPQTRVENLYGLSRTQRAQGPEGANLLVTLTDDDWFSCSPGDVLQKCVDAMNRENKKVLSVKNTAPIHTLCGDILVSQAKPTPWSYRKLIDESHSPSYIVKVNVQCD